MIRAFTEADHDHRADNLDLPTKKLRAIVKPRGSHISLKSTFRILQAENRIREERDVAADGGV